MPLPIVQTVTDFDTSFESDTWSDVARAICSRYYDLDSLPRARAHGSEHIVFLLGDHRVLKIYRPARNCFERERRGLEFVRGKTLFRMPEIVEVGRFENLDYLIMTQLGGSVMDRSSFLGLEHSEQVGIITELAEGLRQLHSLDPASVHDGWTVFVDDRAETFLSRQIAYGVNERIVDALPAFIDKHLGDVPMKPTVFLHGDVHFGNLRFERESGNWRIAGLFDFADSLRGFHEYDFLAVGLLMLQGMGELQREFFRAYGYSDADLDAGMRRRLMMLTMLYETSDLRRYAIRLRPDAVDLLLEELEREIWSFAD